MPHRERLSQLASALAPKPPTQPLLPHPTSSEAMDISFRGQTALVTGAGKGIGRDTAILLAACHADVIALSRSADDLASLQQEIDCRTICVDLADVEAVKAALSDVGPVDLLVNNAAIALNEPFFETSVENFVSAPRHPTNTRRPCRPAPTHPKPRFPWPTVATVGRMLATLSMYGACWS